MPEISWSLLKMNKGGVNRRPELLNRRLILQTTFWFDDLLYFVDPPRNFQWTISIPYIRPSSYKNWPFVTLIITSDQLSLVLWIFIVCLFSTARDDPINGQPFKELSLVVSHWDPSPKVAQTMRMTFWPMWTARYATSNAAQSQCRTSSLSSPS